MNKIWTGQYLDGVSTTITPDLYENITDFFEEGFERYRLHPISTCSGVTHTYDDVDKASIAIGAWLQAQGIPKGSIVALMMPNIPQYLPTMIGILRAGYVCTPINPLYTARELLHQLNDSGAQTIFLVENVAQILEQVIDDTNIKYVVLTKMGDMMGVKGLLTNVMHRHVPKYKFDNPIHLVYKFQEVLKEGVNLPLYQPLATIEETAILQYTGGSTGLAKGAILSQRNIISAALQSEAWYRPATKGINQVYINMVMAMPLYHIFAFMMALLGMRAGYTFILVPNPRDMPAFVKTLSRQPFHIFPGINILFKGLLDQPDFKNLDFSSLSVTQAGGMIATEQTANLWLETTGCPIIEGWGMSESVGVGTANNVTNKSFNGTIGLPVASMDVVIRDDDGNDVGLNTPGELCIKGPNVTSGYYKKDSMAYFTEDGYFKTGDIVSMNEEGYITLLDRKQNMILVSGFKVSPNEIEAVMAECPGVSSIAAIGVHDDEQGESVMLFVVPNNPNLTEDDVMNFAQDNLTPNKCPSHIKFVDQLPTSHIGKVLRKELREQLEQNQVPSA